MIHWWTRLDFQPFEGVRFHPLPVCAKERGCTKRLEIKPIGGLNGPKKGGGGGEQKASGMIKRQRVVVTSFHSLYSLL